MKMLRDIDDRFGRYVRWITPFLVIAFGAAMLYLREQFYTRAEAEALKPVPGKVQQLEVDIAPLRPIPARVQRLEERADSQVIINDKRDSQIAELTRALQQLTVQQTIAITKLDDITRRSARMEDKVDEIRRDAR